MYHPPKPEAPLHRPGHHGVAEVDAHVDPEVDIAIEHLAVAMRQCLNPELWRSTPRCRLSFGPSLAVSIKVGVEQIGAEDQIVLVVLELLEVRLRSDVTPVDHGAFLQFRQILYRSKRLVWIRIVGDFRAHRQQSVGVGS